jgi:uncharacterized protein (TIGR02001 family)
MKKLLPTLCAAAGIFAATLTSAQAQDFSANISVTNNYVWRGITQTNGDFAVQGGADVEFGSGFSVGAWASNVDFGDATEAEIDLYGNFAIPLTDMVTANLGGILYLFPGQPSGADYTFFEFNGGLDFDLGMATLSTSVAYSPDVGGDTTWYFNGGLGVPVGEYFELFGSVGYYEWETAVDYLDYAVGVSATWQNFTVSTYYAGTDFAGDDGSFVVMLTAAIP